MIHLLRVVEEMYGHWWLGQSRWNRVGLWLSKIRVTDRKLCRSLGHEELLGVVGETYIIALFEAALLSAPAIAVTSHGSHGVPNHRQIDCMFSSLFEIATTKRVKHCITDPLWGHTPVTDGFPSQRSSNDAESMHFIWVTVPNGPVRLVLPWWINLSPAYLRNGLSALTAKIPVEWKTPPSRLMYLQVIFHAGSYKIDFHGFVI